MFKNEFSFPYNIPVIYRLRLYCLKSPAIAGEEVLANRIGNVVMLMPKDDPWASMLKALSMFTEDCFQQGISDPPPEGLLLENWV